MDYAKYVNRTDYADKEAWRQAEGAVLDLFRIDLFAQHGVTGHPKVEQAYAFAWEHGHANGLSDVAYWFGEVVGFIV